MIDVLSRADFLVNYWDWRPGQHVTVLGPTESGKTWLTFDLLRPVATPQMPALCLVAKPKDDTVEKLGGKNGLGFRKVRDWPPIPSPAAAMAGKPSGWILHPRHSFDPDVDDANLERIFRRALLDSYKKGKRIVFADEVSNLIEDLHLRSPLRALWKRGRSQGAALFTVDQRPAWLPREAYSQAAHLFLGNTGDREDRKKYGDIGGGVDSKYLESIVVDLGQREFVWVKRYQPGGTALCVVTA